MVPPLDPPVLQPQKPTRVQIYEAVKRAIIEGQLPIGDRLAESRLVEWLGVSRTPVRESFGQLEQEGWITRLPAGGYVVSPIDVDEAKYVYRARAAIEGLLVRDACDRITPEQAADLQARAEVPDQTTQGYSIPRSPWNIHVYIAELSEDRVAKRLLAQITDRVELYRSLTVRVYGRLEEARAEHERLVAAIIRGDRGSAQRFMEEHILRAGSALIAALAQVES